jgi:hypothetical protein
LIDKGVLEIFGPAGIAKTTANTGVALHRMRTGQVYRYAYTMLIFLMILVILFDFFN